MRTIIAALSALSVISGVTLRVKERDEPQIVRETPSFRSGCTDHVIENRAPEPVEILLDCGMDRETPKVRLDARVREEIEVCVERGDRPRCSILSWKIVR